MFQFQKFTQNLAQVVPEYTQEQISAATASSEPDDNRFFILTITIAAVLIIGLIVFIRIKKSKRGPKRG